MRELDEDSLSSSSTSIAEPVTAPLSDVTVRVADSDSSLQFFMFLLSNEVFGYSVLEFIWYSRNGAS